MSVRRLLETALAAADRAGVREARGWHLTPARLNELAIPTLRHLRGVATSPSAFGDDWRMVSARSAGVLSWWAEQADLASIQRRRLRPLRTDVYDLLGRQGLIVKDPGQGSPVHVSPATSGSPPAGRAGEVSMVTWENLGAWMVKCNPQTWRLGDFLEAGVTEVTGWAVQDNYRSGLMRYGDPIFFWVSGRAGARLSPGIWGVGRVLGPPEWGFGDDYWVDEDASSVLRLFTPVTIPLLDEPVLRSTIADDRRLASLEVLRIRQMGNPLYVSPEQAEALFEIVGDPPETPDPMPELVTIGAHGAGFGDPATNAIVEEAAMIAARDHLEADNWTVRDVSREKRGWDLTARRRSGVLHVEVKGVTSTKPSILLTRNEHRVAQNDPDWILIVVTEALSRQRIRRFDADTVVAACAPYAFRADLEP